jgi:hypothetical protein
MWKCTVKITCQKICKLNVFTKSMVCNQKRGVLPTHRIIEPLIPRPFLINFTLFLTYKLTFMVHLSTDSGNYTQRIGSIPHMTTGTKSQKCISFLPSFLIHTNTNQEQHSPIIFTDYLQTESPSSFFNDKSSTLQVFQSSTNTPSLTLLCNQMTLIRTTRRSGISGVPPKSP